MVNVRASIINALKVASKEVVQADVNFLVEKPENENFGDYASNIALAIFSSSKFKTPMELAQKIVDKLNSPRAILPNIDKVEAVKPGFINFYLSEKYLISNLEEILNKKNYGSKPQDLSKKVVVEYSSPNIAKPFTVGHLRSTIIGDAVANLLEANGWKVYRDNHVGDWGTQFGKQIYAIKTWGEAQIEKSKNPVKELVALYIKFHKEAEKNPELEEKGREWFKKLEEGDKEARRLWKKCVDWSLKEFENIYKVLRITFTENDGLGFGESFFEDKIKDVLEELNTKKLLKESEGAKLVFFEKDPSKSSGQAKYPPLMIVKKDGATLYATRDLATDKFRLEKYPGAKIINEVGIEQSLYFKQLFEVEKMLGWVKERQRIHIKHGHYRFKDKKMSTRKGNVVWLKEVLEEAIKRAEKLGSKERHLAEKVGIGALKWNDLKRSSHLDIVFDWDEILNMQGDSGPYIQYTFARTQSVVRKSEIRNPKSEINSNNQNSKFKKRFLSFEHSNFDIVSSFDIRYSNLQLEPEEVSLLRAIYRFPEVVEEAASSFAPNILCNYLFDLAQKFNLFYQKHKILESEQREFRIQLTVAVGQIIKNGLHLLGIQAPERM